MSIQATNGSANLYSGTFEQSQSVTPDLIERHKALHAKLHELDEWTIALRAHIYGLSVQ